MDDICYLKVLHTRISWTTNKLKEHFVCALKEQLKLSEKSSTPEFYLVDLMAKGLNVLVLLSRFTV